MKTKIITSTIVSTILLSALTGCGGSSSSDTTTSTTDTTVASTTSSSSAGQLVDSYVENADYRCGDGSVGITDENGTFDCENNFPIEFSLSGLKLGVINALPTDRQVFPQDLLGVQRDDVNNSEVVAMARFLQSCDDDNDSRNGIRIREQVKASFENADQNFSALDLDAYVSDANITLVDDTTAIEHLTTTVDLVTSVEESDLPPSVSESILTPNNTLSQDVKNTLSYMGNEERLAHDVYTYLYDYHLAHNGVEIKQLINIATNSEYTHIQTVQLLIQKYINSADEFTNIDAQELNYINTPIDEMVPGSYDIEHIQDLYDQLTQLGENSAQSALEVGCIVEVTDINDLLEDIEVAKTSDASDIVSAFEFLRDGSYTHYWSFDKGLKDMGIANGCCSISEEYCHPEYPQITRGRQ
jgi:hypothetical protein